MATLKNLFYLDPEVVFLNHGSFGAAPRPVIKAYQDWQIQLERQPVKFLDRDRGDLYQTARSPLADTLGVDGRDLIFIPNATFGVNLVARSLDFQRGDEVLTTNHEYGACDLVWDFLARTRDLNVVRAEIPLPLPDPDRILELVWEKVTHRTRLIFLSHLTSPTAARLPVDTVCKRARQAGIPVMVDGAHAPGQLDLSLEDLGADFYTGNCHKWLLAPKGSAFLFIRREMQEAIQPLVISWGWASKEADRRGTWLQDYLEWSGTRDPAAYLSVPAALNFREEYRWDEVIPRCQELLFSALDRVQRLTGMPSIYSAGKDPVQMGAAELPESAQPARLQTWLYQQHRIEIPVIHWQKRWLLRISVQAYNTEDDIDRLIKALQEYFGKHLMS